MLNAAERLRPVFDRAKLVLELLLKGALLSLDTDDLRVLVSLRALIVRKPLWEIGVAAQAELPDLLDQIRPGSSTEKGGLDIDNHIRRDIMLQKRIRSSVAEDLITLLITGPTV